MRESSWISKNLFHLLRILVKPMNGIPKELIHSQFKCLLNFWFDQNQSSPSNFVYINEIEIFIRYKNIRLQIIQTGFQVMLAFQQPTPICNFIFTKKFIEKAFWFCGLTTRSKQNSCRNFANVIIHSSYSSNINFYVSQSSGSLLFALKQLKPNTNLIKSAYNKDSN